MTIAMMTTYTVIPNSTMFCSVDDDNGDDLQAIIPAVQGGNVGREEGYYVRSRGLRICRCIQRQRQRRRIIWRLVVGFIVDFVIIFVGFVVPQSISSSDSVEKIQECFFGTW